MVRYWPVAVFGWSGATTCPGLAPRRGYSPASIYVDAEKIRYGIWVSEGDGESHWLYLGDTRFETWSFTVAALKASECRADAARFTGARVRVLHEDDD